MPTCSVISYGCKCCWCGRCCSIDAVMLTCRQAASGEGAQVHQLAAVGAPHPLMLEGPQRSLEALLVVTRHRQPAEAQALAHLQGRAHPPYT